MMERTWRATTDQWENAREKLCQVAWQVGAVAMLVCKEVGSVTEKAHMHGYVQTAGASLGKLKYAMQKAFPDATGPNWQSSHPTGNKGLGSRDKALRYISKGANRETPPEVLFSYKFSDQQVKDLHDAYWAQGGSMNYVKVEVKKPTIYETLKELCKDCKDDEDVLLVCSRWYINVQRHVSWFCFKDVVRKLVWEKFADENTMMSLLRDTVIRA